MAPMTPPAKSMATAMPAMAPSDMQSSPPMFCWVADPSMKSEELLLLLEPGGEEGAHAVETRVLGLQRNIPEEVGVGTQRLYSPSEAPLT